MFSDTENYIKCKCQCPVVIPICLQIFSTETGPQNWKYLLSGPLQKKFAEPCSCVKGENPVAQGDAETYRVEMSFQRSPCFLFKNTYLFICLAASGLSCSTWVMQYLSLRCTGLVAPQNLRILITWPGIEPMYPALQGGFFFFSFIYIYYCNVSGTQQGDSVIHIHIYYFSNYFPL